MDDFRIVARAPGDRDMLVVEPIEATEPGAGEARVRHKAVGVNFIDVYHRTGLYPGPIPIALGGEAAGIVEAVGPGVEHVRVGDRVAYGSGGSGAYATVRTIGAEHLFKLPDAVSCEVAAAAMLKGMTVAFMVSPCAKVSKGQTVLVHAAAGGVGSILVSWLKSLDTTVIAHVGSPAKMASVTERGADFVLDCPFSELADNVRSLTDGQGVDVVFDGVGSASWEASVASSATRGLLVSFGNASGAVEPVRLLDLMRAGSLFVTRPTMAHYARNRAEREVLVAATFEKITSGDVPISIGQRFTLRRAADAHEALENRATLGATILVPEE